MILFSETVAVVSSVFVRVMNVQDVPCSLSGQLVQCVVGNPLKGRTGSTSKILLDATHLSATRNPLYIAVNVTTLVLACFLCCIMFMCSFIVSFVDLQTSFMSQSQMFKHTIL